MPSMITSILFLAAAGHAVYGHTLFTNFFVDGVNQGNATCVRMSNFINNATSPLPDVTSPDMACGVNGETAVAFTCPVNSGSSISFEYRDWPDGSQPGSIDKSHKGPCAVYMKKVDDATKNGTAAGDGWFKIFSQDYDNTTSQWCTEKIIANNGHMTIDLPRDLEAGDYLLRSELLALHQADKNPPDPQFYVGCAQVFLNSTGSAKPSDSASIPGYVNMSMPAMTFNIYNEPMALPYPMFGPPVYVSDGSSKRGLNPRSTITQTTGLVPPGCVLTVGNWCGIELDSFTTEAGCWNASKNCFDQESVCYSSAGPTGGKNCGIWDQKCKTVQSACNAGNFNGPPNEGQNLTPAVAKVALPPAYANTGDIAAAASASVVASPDAQSSSSAPAAPAATPAAASGPTAAAIQQPASGSVSECGSRNNSAVCASGMCCSAPGYCGISSDYCGTGCQSSFGACGAHNSMRARYLHRHQRQHLHAWHT